MKLTIKGYKSISSPTSIELNGLTILSGTNSSGKSSFMQPFLLLKQTVESNFDTGAILLDGANAKLTDSSEAISRIAGKKNNTLSISIEESKKITSIEFTRHRKFGLVVDSCKLIDEDFPSGLALRRRMTHEDITKQIHEESNPFVKIFSDSLRDAKWSVVQQKCFLYVESGFGKGKNSPLKVGISPSAAIENFVKHLIHVPGLRGNPERSYRLTNPGEIFPGSFELYVASILNDWKTNSRQKAKFNQLKDDLNTLGLASHIDTERLNDTRLEVRVSRYRGAPESDCVNIADVGFGVSQTLPVLVALLAANKKQCVYIEQPELHLHPRAQYRLAEIIARSVRNGARVIIETHSSILIRGIQTLVAQGKISKEKISLHWFTQDQNSGESLVSEATLDHHGAFGEWPADFDEVALEADSAYLDAVEESSYGKA